jgi:hypothetical protein
MVQVISKQRGGDSFFCGQIQNNIKKEKRWNKQGGEISCCSSRKK